jgi:glycosyltransferase involved in cell wall biosynthesis
MQKIMGKAKFISVVVPALNEEITIGEFVDWCKQGLHDAGREGEILIIDSSSDRTPEIAEAHGARVIKVPKRGLGHAYIDAMPHIRGDYVIMGDCDLTYDFRELKHFIEKLDNGYDFVMGTRMKGYIEPGAMPSLHRFFGTPLTTFILNRMYGSKFSDIHCGMRAMTLEALKKLDIESTSWEYASEMVLKVAKLGLKVTEIPIKFYKDREGRLSHMKRGGWFSPWYAGWINLKVMFLYNPDFFLFKPGLMIMVLGITTVIFLLIRHSIKIGNITLEGHGMFLGVTLAVVGYSAIQMAILSKIFYNFVPVKNQKYKNIFKYNNGVIGGSLMMLTGLLFLVDFISLYIKSDFSLHKVSNPAIVGLLLIILGFQTFTFTLMLQMIANKQQTNERKTDSHRTELTSSEIGPHS